MPPRTMNHSHSPPTPPWRCTRPRAGQREPARGRRPARRRTGPPRCNLYYPDKGSVNHASTARAPAQSPCGLPHPNGQTCGLSVDPDEAPSSPNASKSLKTELRSTSQSTGYHVVGGVLGDGTGLSYGYVSVYDANWAQVGNAQADSDGTWSIEVMPGTYRVNAYYSDRSGGNASTNNEPQPFTADTTVAVHPPSVPVSVNLLGADGQPADGQARLMQPLLPRQRLGEHAAPPPEAPAQSPCTDSPPQRPNLRTIRRPRRRPHHHPTHQKSRPAELRSTSQSNRVSRCRGAR